MQSLYLPDITFPPDADLIQPRHIALAKREWLQNFESGVIDQTMRLYTDVAERANALTRQQLDEDALERTQSLIDGAVRLRDSLLKRLACQRALDQLRGLPDAEAEPAA